MVKRVEVPVFLKGDLLMKHVSYLIETLVMSIMFCFFTYQDVYAYLDPGTGSYVLQMVIAGLLGAFFFIKLSWKKMMNFFSNLSSKRKDGRITKG
jgi:membrane associated rhomboid family serine protease